MAFYVKPPKGVISQIKLRQYAEKRLRFLSDIVKYKNDDESMQQLIESISTVYQSECLIDGSVSDRISHFILRLIFCKDVLRAEWFIDAECVFFKLRSDKNCWSDKINFLNQAESHAKQIIKSPKLSNSHQEVLLTLISVSKLMKNRFIPSIIKVPFQHALTFVQQREFPIEKGQILFPVERIDDLLESLHRLTLCEGISHMKNMPFINNDSRINDIKRYISKFFRCEISSLFNLDKTEKSLLACEIENVSFAFPPCMEHLYKILKNRHRLQHSTRIQLTLFLKDIGLPIDEALLFWEKEYSKPITGYSVCSHLWSKESRRYKYNIRHLYGQEGSNKTYLSHSCKTLQECLLKSNDEGGCPFAQHDISNINKFIQDNNIQEPYLNNILECSQQKRFEDACLQYFQGKLSNITCKNKEMNLSLFKFNGKSFNYNNDCKLVNNDSNNQREFNYLSKIEVSKPVDYFKSFQMLLDGLKNNT